MWFIYLLVAIIEAVHLYCICSICINNKKIVKQLKKINKEFKDSDDNPYDEEEDEYMED